MKQYKNKFNVVFTVGQIGIMSSRFKKIDKKTRMLVVSFTTNGRYMRCKNLDIPDSAPDRIKNTIYLFNTDSMMLKGSHMGNCKIDFNNQKQYDDKGRNGKREK